MGRKPFWALTVVAALLATFFMVRGAFRDPHGYPEQSAPPPPVTAEQGAPPA
jgi:hypothetical protein